MAQNNSKRTAWRNVAQIAAGIALGLILSVIEPALFILTSVALAVIFFVRMCRVGWQRDALAVLTACAVMTLCLLLPTKQLDVKVGPFAYDDLPLSDLCARLREDHGIICRLSDRPGPTCRLSFCTDQPLSRRKVLEKLSQETNRRLHIGHCGTNATILFGGHPCFTYLEPEREEAS